PTTRKEDPLMTPTSLAQGHAPASPGSDAPAGRTGVDVASGPAAPGPGAAQGARPRSRAGRRTSVRRRLMLLAGFGMVGVLVIGALSVMLLNRLAASADEISQMNATIGTPLNHIHQDQIKGRMIIAQMA